MMILRYLTLLVFFSFFSIPSLEGKIISRNYNRYDRRSSDIAIAAIFQNEGPYLKEWIEFHRMIGVKHFYLYNNQSTDNYQSVINPYVIKGIVELYDVPVDLSDGKIYLEWQVKVYNHALKQSKTFNKWLAFIDIDEFICLPKENNLLDVLSKYNYAGGVCANWVMYGTSSIYDLAQGEMLIEKLNQRFPLEWGENTLVKSIVRPEFVIECIDAHTFKYTEGVFAVHPDHQKFSHTRVYSQLPVEDIRINHYWYRTEKFFFEVKLPRRRRWGDGRTNEQICEHMDLANSIEDQTMQKFVAPLKKRMPKAL